jgi:hypothetical protein
MEPQELFCQGEGAMIPTSEFRRDAKEVLCNPLIHDTARPHYANGRTYNGGPGCGTATGPGPDVLPDRDINEAESA